MVTGIIVRATSIQPFILKAAFTCGQCGETLLLDQTDQFLKTPRECSTCGSRRGFELNAKESVFIDSQRFAIQERPEELPAGQLPRQVNVELRDDIVDITRPGDRVSITGVLNLIRKQTRGGTLRVFDFTLEANNVAVSGREMELLEITEEDEEEIREIASDPWVHRRLLQSIAPSIFGLDSIKESILYLLFNGVSKNLPDVRIRGDINVLLVGDPGTGKSQLLGFAAKVAPRGLITTGRGSTAAGLTAAVVREGGTGSFVLEAGALVLGDKGVVCIDEMDKMRDEDRGAIHPAMEQQVVSIAKGGIVATLNARTSILAAANPTLGRYNPYQTIAQNISLPVTLLSRFDLIFVLRDIPEKERDNRMAEHILRLHLTASSPDTTHLNTEILRKYISYARRIDPRLTGLLRQDEDRQPRGGRSLRGEHHSPPARVPGPPRRGPGQGPPQGGGHSRGRRGRHRVDAEEPGAGGHRRGDRAVRHRYSLHREAPEPTGPAPGGPGSDRGDGADRGSGQRRRPLRGPQLGSRHREDRGRQANRGPHEGRDHLLPEAGILQEDRIIPPHFPLPGASEQMIRCFY